MTLATLDSSPPDADHGSVHGPGRLGPVVRWNAKTGTRHLDRLEWGLLPHDTKDPVRAFRPTYARVETVASHPMFASAFRQRRAIVPMSVYYQRRTTGGPKERFTISRKDGQLMSVAGLWEAYRWPDGTVTRSYCIITVPANRLVAAIHDRMPIVLEKTDWPVWLGEVPGDPAALLRPPSEDVLHCLPVYDGRGRRPRDFG